MRKNICNGMDAFSTLDDCENKIKSLPRLGIYQTNLSVRCKFCENSQHKWKIQYASFTLLIRISRFWRKSWTKQVPWTVQRIEIWTTWVSSIYRYNTSSSGWMEEHLFFDIEAKCIFPLFSFVLEFFLYIFPVMFWLFFFSIFMFRIRFCFVSCCFFSFFLGNEGQGTFW